MDMDRRINVGELITVRLSRKSVRAEVVKVNTLTIDVRLKNGSIVQRKLGRDY